MTSVQTLRLELEHQLGLNRQLIERLETQRHEATERARAYRHELVDFEATSNSRPTQPKR